MLNASFINATGQEISRNVQYLQIEFMRLFKICKELGCVKRKRNMPVDYPHAEARARQAVTRLMRTLTDHLFPKDEGFSIYTSRERFNIQPNFTTRNVICFANTHVSEMRRQPNAVELARLFDGFMNPAVARVHVRMFSNQFRVDPSPNNGYRTPNFCACAKELIEFKNAFMAFYVAWVAHMEGLKTVQEREAEQREAEIEIARQAEVRRAAEEARQRSRAPVTAATAEARRASMQQSFNQSLENFRNRNRMNDECA